MVGKIISSVTVTHYFHIHFYFQHILMAAVSMVIVTGTAEIRTTSIVAANKVSI